MSISKDLDEALPENEPTEEKEPVTKDEESEETTEKEEDKASEDVEEDEGDDEEDDDDLEEEDDEDDLELKSTKQPSVVTRIKKAFPNFRKQFPEVIDSYFQAQEFKQTFASPDDAKLAAEKSDLLDGLISNASDGEVEPFLDFIYEQDPKGLQRLVHNFLPTLSKKSPEMFTTVVTPIVDNVFAKIYQRAKNTGDEQTQLAVKYCLRAMGRNSIPGFKALEPVFDNENNDNNRNKVEEERENTFYGAVTDIIDPLLDKEINTGLDPEEALPEGLREEIIAKVKRAVYEKLKNNSEHMLSMKALRKSAQQNNYSREWQKRVAKATMNAAKELIPSVRAQVKKRMLGDMVGNKLKLTPKKPAAVEVNNSSEKKEKSTINWDEKNPIRAALDKAVVS